MVQKIDKLTPEQEALCARIVKEYVAILDGNPDNDGFAGDRLFATGFSGLSLAAITAKDTELRAEFSGGKKSDTTERIAAMLEWAIAQSRPLPEAEAKIKEWLAVVYEGESQPVPPIVVCASPKAAIALANSFVDGPRVSSLDHSGLADAGWVSYSDAMLQLGAQTEEEASRSMKLKAYLRMIFDSTLLGPGPSSKTGCAVLIQHAKHYRRDSEGQLHCKDGSAIEWHDGEKVFFWHSVQVPEKLVVAPETYTADDYRAISQTEVRRAFGERIGWNHVVELIGSTLVNEWKDGRTGLEYALFRTERGAGGRVEQWLRKQSPALMNDAQPLYFEPVHEDLRTAQAARKWQAIPELRPEECERDPALNYGQET